MKPALDFSPVLPRRFLRIDAHWSSITSGPRPTDTSWVSSHVDRVRATIIFLSMTLRFAEQLGCARAGPCREALKVHWGPYMAYRPGHPLLSPSRTTPSQYAKTSIHRHPGSVVCSTRRVSHRRRQLRLLTNPCVALWHMSGMTMTWYSCWDFSNSSLHADSRRMQRLSAVENTMIVGPHMWRTARSVSTPWQPLYNTRCRYPYL